MLLVLSQIADTTISCYYGQLSRAKQDKIRLAKIPITITGQIMRVEQEKHSGIKLQKTISQMRNLFAWRRRKQSRQLNQDTCICIFAFDILHVD